MEGVDHEVLTSPFKYKSPRVLMQKPNSCVLKIIIINAPSLVRTQSVASKHFCLALRRHRCLLMLKQAKFLSANASEKNMDFLRNFFKVQGKDSRYFLVFQHGLSPRAYPAVKVRNEKVGLLSQIYNFCSSSPDFSFNGVTNPPHCEATVLTAAPAFHSHTGSPCCPEAPGDPGTPGDPVQV